MFSVVPLRQVSPSIYADVNVDAAPSARAGVHTFRNVMLLTIRGLTLAISRPGRNFLPGREADYRIITADRHRVGWHG